MNNLGKLWKGLIRMTYSFKGKRERDRARQQAAVIKKAKVKAALVVLGVPKPEPKPIEIPKREFRGIDTYFTNTHGERRWFEVVVRMSDGRLHTFELDMEALKELGTGITSLRQTKVFKDWIFSDAGREYIEAQVNAK